MTKKTLLTPEMVVAIDKELAKFPEDKRISASLSAIRIVQDYGNGSVTDEQLDAIADYLGVPHMSIYEVATFYTMCKREPIGKYHIGVCTNLSCQLNNCEATLNRIKEKLNIDVNEVTPDGQFSLEEVECLGACVNAPVMQVNKQYYECVAEKEVDKILDKFKE